jgi:hypothetical protein
MAGAYLNAACVLTERDGEFDAYTLASEIGQAGYKAARAWINRERRRNGSCLRRVGLPVGGRVLDGGRPTSYAVVEVELRRWRRER